MHMMKQESRAEFATLEQQLCLGMFGHEFACWARG